jgi:hypothetical protein
MYLSRDFARLSLELHLFFLRIMKEHSFFLEIGFTPRDSGFMKKADEFRKEFDKLLWDVVAISGGVVGRDVLQSGEVVTQYTMSAEKASEYYTGVDIPIDITKAEMDLVGSRNYPVNRRLEEDVFEINRRAIELVSALIRFKETILADVLACKMFTVNYPLLIDHILREARLYRDTIQRIQRGEDYRIENEALEQEMFWNRIMAEHSKFIRGLLDPQEEDLFNMADHFGDEFDDLTREAREAMDNSVPFAKVTADSFQATKAIRDFKEQGTQGLINCKIKSIIIPLLADHTLREASHYLRLLRMFRR